MSIRNGGFMAFVGPAQDSGADTSDFRDVPKTDEGNRGYADRGMLGNFSARETPYPSPAGVMRMTGYGADMADLDRGFVAPTIREEPAYDKSNYQDRWTQPREPNEDMSETDVMRQDWEFRGQNQKARGFLTRPRVPTERG